MRDAATRVVLGVPEGTPPSHRDELESTSFRRYLRRAHDTVTVGEEWEEFISGGCGRRNDLTLTVLEVDGERVDDDTEFVYR